MFEDQLNPIHRFFSIRHIYTKVTNTHTSMGKLNGMDPQFTIYAAKTENEYPEIVIIDKDGMINPRDPQLSLQGVDEEEVVYPYVNWISPSAKKQLESIMMDSGFSVPGKNEREGWNLGEELAKTHLCHTPIMKLRDPEFVKTMDWPWFVTQLIRWESEEKDSRLNTVHKAMLLRGIEPRANTHALICTNSGTGKSIHFQIHGINYDKVTKNSFLGYAKSPKEIFKGTIDGTDLPIGIDQIEIGNWGIMDFMFNAMEYGESRISSGAVDIPIKTKAPIALIANPLEEGTDPEKGFSYILSHLSNNPAIGRRFGVICYGTDYKVITTRSTQASIELWRESSTFFRAVEEYIRPELYKIYHADELWAYLTREIDGYYEQFVEIAKSVQDYTIRTFLLEHGKAGQSRARSAAFNASLVDHMKEILIGDYKISDIISHADEVILPDIIQINFESANNIVRTLYNEKIILAEAYLRSVPAYLREIIYAIERARQEHALFSTFLFSTLNYQPICSDYQNLGQCVDKLLQRKKGLAEYNQQCKENFAFVFEPYGKDLKITMLNRIYAKIRLPDVLKDTPNVADETENCITGSNTIPNIPKMNIIPKDIDNKIIESSLVKMGKTGILGIKTKLNIANEIYDLMEEKTAYDPETFRFHFNYEIDEILQALKILESHSKVYQRLNKWYKVVKPNAV